MTDNLNYKTLNDSDGQALDDIIREKLLQINKVIPGFITKVTNRDLVDIQPCFNSAWVLDDGELVVKPYPIIPNCVRIGVRGGGFFVNLPKPKVNDPVLILIADRSIDSYIDSDSKKVMDFENTDIHDLCDAFFISAPITQGNKIPDTAISNDDDLILGKEDGSVKIHIGNDGNVRIKANTIYLNDMTANKALALAEKVNDRCGALETAINTHLHTSTAPATPTSTATPPVVFTTGSVASSKVFTNG